MCVCGARSEQCQCSLCVWFAFSYSCRVRKPVDEDAKAAEDDSKLATSISLMADDSASGAADETLRHESLSADADIEDIESAKRTIEIEKKLNFLPNHVQMSRHMVKQK